MRVDEKFRVNHWKTIRIQPNLPLRTCTHVKPWLFFAYLIEQKTIENLYPSKKIPDFLLHLIKKIKNFLHFVEKSETLFAFVGKK